LSDLDFEGYLREQAATEPAPGEAELAARLAAGDTTPQEQAAAEPEAPVVEEAAPAEAEQHRDEQGRFAAKDDVVEQRLKEKDRVIGSMAQELGDLRKMVEERIPAQPEQQYDLSGAAAAILENPGLAPQAAMLALKQGDDLAYEQVLRAWHEVDPFAAVNYNQRKLAWEAQQALRAEIAPQIQTASQLADREALAEASETLARQYTDFGGVIAALDPDTHKMPERYAARLAAATTAEEKEGALEDIYFWAERQVGTQKQAAVDAAQAEDAAASREQKQQATVASASSAPATEGTGDPELDAFHQALLAPSPWQRPAR
jgi:hypothetical protein